MISFTEAAAHKAKQIIGDAPYLRVGVQGGGCSGFQYSMQIDTEKGPMDRHLEFFGLEVLLDMTSAMYLGECIVDYVEGLDASGFKFNNPNVKTTCGCGQSFAI